MQAVIMAGGKGTRLASVTKNEVPKPLVPVLDKPLLERQIEVLRDNGIADICIVIGFLGDKIRERLGDGSAYNVKINYIEENEPLGTAGSFYYLKDFINEDDFLLVFGDVLFDVDISRMAASHTANNSLATLFVHPNSHPFDSDLVSLDSDGRILGFDSKHNERNYWYDNCVNAGLYILDKGLCNLVKEPVKTDLEKDILFPLIQKGERIYGYKSPEYIKDIGTVERIRSAETDLQRGFIEKRCLKNKQKCIFLDRDGTVNVLKGLLYKESDFELEETVVEAIKKINSSEWLCIVVTNQPVVARGMCSESDVDNIHKKMSTLLGRESAWLDGVYFCPHHPDKGYPEENPAYKIKCRCRKPDTGMVEAAAEKYNIDLQHSWIVGDTTLDIQTGVNAGLHTALVLTGEAGKDGKFPATPEITGRSLVEIVNKIIGEN